MVKKTAPCTDSRCEKIENIDLFRTQPETETEKRTVIPAADPAALPV